MFAGVESGVQVVDGRDRDGRAKVVAGLGKAARVGRGGRERDVVRDGVLKKANLIVYDASSNRKSNY